jgi:hypothetical protein
MSEPSNECLTSSETTNPNSQSNNESQAQSKPIEPETSEAVKEVETALNQIAEAKAGPRKFKASIFVAIPNMIDVNAGLVNKLFVYACQDKYRVAFRLFSEVRFHDHVRNRIGAAFLKSDCEYLAMFDADTDPHPNFLSLTDEGKDVHSGNVFCYVKKSLMPSIWESADCEECFCRKKWLDEGVVHDPEMFRGNNDRGLDRWNPFIQRWEKYCTKHQMLPGIKCRCKGTGRDPWVFKTHRKATGQAGKFRVDSVGAAALLIKRSTLEDVPFPWFQFLYKDCREIILTEDHFFCWKAQCFGKEIWADGQMASHHYKTINLLEFNNKLVEAFNAGKAHGEKAISPLIVSPNDATIRDVKRTKVR